MKVKTILPPALAAAVFLGLWQGGAMHTLLRLAPFQLPLPTEIVAALASSLPQTARDSAHTLTGALIGIAIGSAMGFAVALLATRFPKGGKGALTLASALNAVPIVALSPIMNRWFSSGMWQKVGVVSAVTMAAMAINAYRGLNDLRPFALDLMSSYSAKPSATFAKLRLPACLPSVFTALKINVAAGMIAAIVSEYFAATTVGLGFGIKDNLRKAEMAAGWSYIVVASLAGIALYLAIQAIERKAIGWHASARGGES